MNTTADAIAVSLLLPWCVEADRYYQLGQHREAERVLRDALATSGYALDGAA